MAKRPQLEIDTFADDLDVRAAATVLHADKLADAVSGDHTVVVCGASRGGTTATAYALLRAGLDMGPELPLNLEDPAFVRAFSGTEFDEAAFADALAARAGTPRWGFKVPAAAFHLKALEERLPNPIFVVTLRSPLAVANSVVRREHAYRPLPDSNDFAQAFQHPLAFFQAVGAQLPELSAPVILVDHGDARHRSLLFAKTLLGLLKLDTSKAGAIAGELRASGYKALHGDRPPLSHRILGPRLARKIFGESRPFQMRHRP